MVKTASTMLPLGTKAPEFSLPNVDGKTVALKDVAGGKGLLVMFICNHCPFVKHLRSALAAFGKEY
ncbi:MAG TPA: redoxin domain-containing protein, partial [Planctomycetaceae bacterium]|nr:redoxin domain-containing protein [Planctomycetaceae bacterium]